MKKKDKEKVDHFIATRKKAHAFYMKKSEVYRAFVDMEQKTFAEGNLSTKQKELIAIGISVVIDCEPCMQWHIEQALKKGSTEEEIIEAIEVGMEMGGGPATGSARFAMNALEYYRQE